MTAAHNERPLVCGDDILLPLALLAAAIDMEPAGTAELRDVMERPVCHLQGQQARAHCAIVMELDGPDTGAVWVAWTAGTEPRLLVLPDCPAAHPSGMEGCGLFASHVGGHTWEVRDPLEDAARQALAAIPMFRVEGRAGP